MNKRVLVIVVILLVAIVGVLGLGAFELLSPEYKEYSDDKIQVEIPAAFEWNVKENNTEEFNTTVYNTSDDQNGIILISIDPNSSYASEYYNISLSAMKNALLNTEIDSSEYDYNGTIYKVSEKQGLSIPGYIILLEYPDKMTYVMIVSNEVENVVHMGETFKLK